MGYEWFDGTREAIQSNEGAYIRRSSALDRLTKDGPQNLFFPNDYVVLGVCAPMATFGLMGTVYSLLKGAGSKYTRYQIFLDKDAHFLFRHA